MKSCIVFLLCLATVIIAIQGRRFDYNQDFIDDERNEKRGGSMLNIFYMLLNKMFKLR